MATSLDCKPVEVLGKESICFNGICIKIENENYLIGQQDHIQMHQTVQTKNIEKSKYIAQRARGAYIASTAWPDISYGFAVASQIADPDTQSVQKMNGTIKQCHKSLQF